MLQPSMAPPSSRQFCSTIDGLASVFAPGVNLALWQRPPVAEVERELLALGASALPDVRRRTSPETVRADCASVLEERGLGAHRFRRWIEDIAHLLDTFHRLAEGRPITLRLETLADDGCTRFHVDRTHLRLLCTYRGPGTEYLDNAQVNRAALGCGQPNEAIIRQGTPSGFQPYWVGIMKGARFPGEEHNALVHRSPPLTGSGWSRVLVCLDAAPE